jgi:hypothetical protein
MKRLFLFIMFMSLCSSGAVFTQASLILINAKVITLDDQQPRAEAVAISGNKILEVGSAKKIILCC